VTDIRDGEGIKHLTELKIIRKKGEGAKEVAD